MCVGWRERGMGGMGTLYHGYTQIPEDAIMLSSKSMQQQYIAADEDSVCVCARVGN